MSTVVLTNLACYQWNLSDNWTSWSFFQQVLGGT